MHGSHRLVSSSLCFPAPVVVVGVVVVVVVAAAAVVVVCLFVCFAVEKGNMEWGSWVQG